MARRWRQSVRTLGAAFLFHSHAIDLVVPSRRRRRFVLGYHRVLPEGSGDRSFVQPGMYVTRETFEMHVRYLLGHFAVVPLEELVSMEDGDACAVTFDDGWRDNHTAAFPILRQYGVPATIFLASNLVGTTRWPWPDRICFYIHRASPAVFLPVLEGAWRSETAAPLGVAVTRADVFAVAEDVLRQLKLLEHTLLERIVSRVDERFEGLDAALHGQRPWLTWEEAAEMSAHGISFGSHTENHVILNSVPPSVAREEIEESRSAIAARLGRPVAAFCYPNGDYTPEIVRMVREAGYRCAVTTHSGRLESSPSPFELARILLHEDISNTRPLLACALAGL